MNIQTTSLKEYFKDNTENVNFHIQSINLNMEEENSSLLHRHDFYQIIILRKGSGVYFIDFAQNEINTPCVCVIFPQQIHKLELSDDAEGDIIMFDDTIFCSAILANELKEYNVDLQKRINFVDFTNNTSEFKGIYNVLQHILSLDPPLNDIKKIQIKFFIKIIILKIINAASDHVFTGIKSREFDIYIQFRKLVDQEFRSNRKVESYAKKLNISDKKLNAICKQYADKTALIIIHERLTLEIKKIFIFEDISLKEVAFQLDFNSQSALNKYIYSKFKCTPSELKDTVLGSIN